MRTNFSRHGPVYSLWTIGQTSAVERITVAMSITIEVMTLKTTEPSSHADGEGRADRTMRGAEDTLLRRIADGEKEAFMEFYQIYGDRLFTFCLRMIKDRDKAKDALQNACIKIYERAGQYQESSNATAWVYRVTRNVCIDMIRAEKEYDPLDDETMLPVNDEGPGDVMLQEALTNEIDALPPIYREAVLLRDVQGHSYKEIAEIIDAPLSTIKFRIFKARDILRERLQEYLRSDNE